MVLIKPFNTLNQFSFNTLISFKQINNTINKPIIEQII